MSEAKRILITGATGNIGGGAALELARRGSKIVLLGRSRKKLEARAESIRVALSKASITTEEDHISVLVVDFSDMESVRLAAAEALCQSLKIHGLIHCAVVYAQGGPTILPSGHEFMFATNVMGPFLFTQLLIERLAQSRGLILHVVAPFHGELDWSDPESIKDHKTSVAYNRTKACGRALAGEFARRYPESIASVAFYPGFIIDKSDPYLSERWPSGYIGLFWRVAAALFAKPPAVAAGPIADLMLRDQDHAKINGSLFKLDKRIEKPDRAMNDVELGKRLWDELIKRTG